MKKTIPVVVAVMIILLVTGCNDTSSEQPTQNSTTTTAPTQDDDGNFGKPQTRTNPENGQQEHGTGVGGGWQVNPDGSLGYDFGF